jgi:hypothetical protein
MPPPPPGPGGGYGYPPAYQPPPPPGFPDAPATTHSQSVAGDAFSSGNYTQSSQGYGPQGGQPGWGQPQQGQSQWGPQGGGQPQWGPPGGDHGNVGLPGTGTPQAGADTGVGLAKGERSQLAALLRRRLRIRGDRRKAAQLQRLFG